MGVSQLDRLARHDYDVLGVSPEYTSAPANPMGDGQAQHGWRSRLPDRCLFFRSVVVRRVMCSRMSFDLQEIVAVLPRLRPATTAPTPSSPSSCQLIFWPSRYITLRTSLNGTCWPTAPSTTSVILPLADEAKCSSHSQAERFLDARR